MGGKVTSSNHRPDSVLPNMSGPDASGPDAELKRLIEALAAQAEASARALDFLTSRALPLLERIAVALERSPAPPVGVAPADRDDVPAGDADDLRDRIEAARKANDPEGAMASRDELARVLRGEPLKEIDRSLARWLMGLIQRRLRGGTIRPDVVELATKVADRFGATTEGASLGASLPTLRRSAGLCPRCAEPYTGVADACPKCLAAAALAADPVPADPASDPDDLEELEGEPVDLNNDRLWQNP